MIQQRMMRAGVVVVVAALLQAGSALAQEPAPAAPSEVDAVRADSLHELALQRQQESRGIVEAARLYRAEARLRPASDPSAVDALIMAGHLQEVARQNTEARRTLEWAADRAKAMGDLERAARAYLEAAFVAEKQGDGSEVQRLGSQARLIAESPHLKQDQKQNIMRRIELIPAERNEKTEYAANRADSLQQEAERLEGDPRRYSEAAHIYQMEANLRAPDDLNAVDHLILAAHLLFASGRPMDARHALEDAADRASAAGAIQRAAQSYLDAAFVAQEEGNQSEVNRLAGKAKLLCESPQLSDASRQAILRRIGRYPSGS